MAPNRMKTESSIDYFFIGDEHLVGKPAVVHENNIAADTTHLDVHHTSNPELLGNHGEKPPALGHVEEDSNVPGEQKGMYLYFPLNKCNNFLYLIDSIL